MEPFKRMTVEWAQSILEHYELRLGHGLWTPIRHRPDECCPLGLYIIDKDGLSPNFQGFANETYYKEGPDKTTALIADYVGIPRDYAVGLSNGFEETRDNFQCPHLSKGSVAYQLGLEDGRALAALTN